jgi:SAM-dependent methyltransferase
LGIDPRTAGFRSPRAEDYPELAGYSRADAYRDAMGGGGLYLAARMTRLMDLHPGDVVLDLGCGKGESPIFLANRFGVKVVAVDLWTEAAYLASKMAARDHRLDVVPLNLDATGPLPFADGYFDSVFCMLPGGGDVWEGDFLRMKTPAWWERLFRESGLLDVIQFGELEDAAVLYEDLVLHNLEHGLELEDTEHCIEQILWGRRNRPAKTLFALAARKKE